MIIVDFLDKDLEMPLFVEDAVDGVPANLVEGEPSKDLEAELREFTAFVGV
jgi:hypothetical protein